MQDNNYCIDIAILESNDDGPREGLSYSDDDDGVNEYNAILLIHMKNICMD